MRVAIIAEVFLPKIDGVVNRTLNLIDQLRQAGDELLIVCPDAPGCNNCQAPVVSFPSFPFPMYPEYRVGLPDKQLISAVKSFAPDVIHYLNPFAFGFRCHDALRKAGLQTPCVFSFHTLYGEFVKRYKGLKPLSAFLWWLTKEYHNRADVNLTVSSAMQAELERRGFVRTELWPPAVDSEIFRPDRASDSMRRRLTGEHAKKHVLLTVSRLAPEKNVAFLADVLERLPDACLAIVGDGPDRPALERRFAGTPTRFLGYLKGVELAEAYASADAFLYASETETMGNVILEAMACGKAVIAPDAGGIPSIVTHERNALLYRPRDLADAVATTRRALEDLELRELLGAAARDHIEKRGWHESVDRVREMYADAIRTNHQVRSRRRWQDKVAQTSMSALVSTFRAVSKAKNRTKGNALRRLRFRRRRAAQPASGSTPS
jgi:glycosyltransferase involved in cell wall biosynthesis